MARRDVLLDDDGNRSFDKGDYGFADGAQAVKQGIACRVRLWLAEYWLDESLGVSYLDQILIHNPNPLIVKGEISRAIASTPDVTQVVNTAYSVVTATREATVNYTATSTEGIVSGSVTT